jgi:hypothetical protein
MLLYFDGFHLYFPKLFLTVFQILERNFYKYFAIQSFLFSNEINNSLKESVEQNQQANKKIKESLIQLFEQTKNAVSTTSF